MRTVTYMHGGTTTYDELHTPVKDENAAQLIDATIDLWIAGKGPAPALVSDPGYTGPRRCEYKREAYRHTVTDWKDDGTKYGTYSKYDVDVPATEPADAFDGITRADYDAYVSRVKVSRTGVVTAVKARKTAARKTVAKCATCPHCGGTL